MAGGVCRRHQHLGAGQAVPGRQRGVEAAREEGRRGDLREARAPGV